TEATSTHWYSTSDSKSSFVRPSGTSLLDTAKLERNLKKSSEENYPLDTAKLERNLKKS
ncbi:unnamed protein product, partial [Brassica oleracea]